jgi:uncharacterized protein (DUF427 family)
VELASPDGTAPHTRRRAAKPRDIVDAGGTVNKPVKIPGPDHPITIEPTGARVVVRAGDRVIADTEDALTLREASYRPVQYVPVADVDPEVLRASATQTYCPFKGEASYYDVALDDSEIADAIWTYRQPYDAVAEIAGHVAFYADLVGVSVGED